MVKPRASAAFVANLTGRATAAVSASMAPATGKVALAARAMLAVTARAAAGFTGLFTFFRSPQISGSQVVPQLTGSESTAELKGEQPVIELDSKVE